VIAPKSSGSRAWVSSLRAKASGGLAASESRVGRSVRRKIHLAFFGEHVPNQQRSGTAKPLPHELTSSGKGFATNRMFART
jgi:hypothetical protein